MKKLFIKIRLQDALNSWETCDPEVKEKARLFMETWIIPNIKDALEAVKNGK